MSSQAIKHEHVAAKVAASSLLAVATSGGTSRPRGTIRQRGSSFQVAVYAGMDPVTGRRLYLRETTATKQEAQRTLRRLTSQVDEERHAKTQATFRTAMEAWLRTHELDDTTRAMYQRYGTKHIYPVFGDAPVGRVSARVLEEFYAELRRCRIRCDGRPTVDHRTTSPHECRTVRHRRPPGRPPAAGYPPHDCEEKGCLVLECQPHVCVPLAAGTVRGIHFVIRGVLTAAERWEWITANPAVHAQKPRQPLPTPDPPTAAQAASIIEAAWSEDDDWGTLVWLVMVTGLRRGEVLALRWSDIDIDAGVLSVRRAYVRVQRKSIEKDTKTHRMRRLALDATTVDVLAEHRARFESRCRGLGVEASPTAFLFSYRPTSDRPCDPSGVTHRYARMCARIGLDSHLHALRHYSATELLTAGVDLRTVAGRLGHGGGGATTLRVYAAWVDEADRRAADLLGGRMRRPSKATE